jgi:acetylglutamate kinase
MTESRLVVVKIGGSTLGQHDTTLVDVASLVRAGTRVVIVHGGGKVASEWAGRFGIHTEFIRGLRVTSPEMLDVVTATLAGLVNKSLVTSLARLGVNAVGVSGVDARLLQARLADPELGLVGDVEAVAPQLAINLLESGYVPVIATNAANIDPSGPPILNINGDIAAGELAAALQADMLILLSDVPGVLDSAGTLLPVLTPSRVRTLITNGTVTGGMIPKLEHAVRVLAHVGSVHIIDGRQAGVLGRVLAGEAAGTAIQPEETP